MRLTTCAMNRVVRGVVSSTSRTSLNCLNAETSGPAPHPLACCQQTDSASSLRPKQASADTAFPRAAHRSATSTSRVCSRSQTPRSHFTCASGHQPGNCRLTTVLVAHRLTSAIYLSLYVETPPYPCSSCIRNIADTHQEELSHLRVYSSSGAVARTHCETTRYLVQPSDLLLRVDVLRIDHAFVLLRLLVQFQHLQRRLILQESSSRPRWPCT